MKKVYRLSVIFVLVASLVLCIPQVYAAEENVELFDLLNTTSFDRIENGKITETGMAYDRGMSSYVSKVYDVGYTWTCRTVLPSCNAFITIMSSTVPNALKVQLYTNGYTGTATLCGSKGNFHQYKINFNGSVGQITVKAYYNSVYSGNFDICSFVAVKDFGAHITNTDVLIHERYYFQTDSNLGENTRTVVYTENASLPTADWKVNLYDPDSSYVNNATFRFSLNPAQRPFDFSDSITFLLFNYGHLDNVGLCITDGLDNLPSKVVYPSNVSSIISNIPVGYGMGSSVYPYISSYTFDLTGYDLTNKYLQLVGDVFSGYVGTVNWEVYDAWDVRLLDAVMVAPVKEIPWYLEFWNSLNGALNRIFNGNKDIGDKVEAGSNQISDKLDSFINGSAQDNAAADQFENKVDQQIGSFESANDSLNSMEKPSLDSINSDAGAIINPEGMALLAQPLNNIFENKIVLSILLITSTCALIGYVFFGKR